MTAEYWDKRAEKYDDAVRVHDADYDRTVARVKSLISTSDVVLDLGCGSGEYSLDIARFAKRVHGIDTSTRMIALATRKADARKIDNVAFEAVDVFERSLESRGYTVVLAFSVLHLVEELRSVLRRIHELLPAGGLLVSQTPCLGDSGVLWRCFVGAAQMAKVAPPMLRLSARDLEGAMEGAGFDIAASEVWDFRKGVRWIVARKR